MAYTSIDSHRFDDSMHVDSIDSLNHVEIIDDVSMIDACVKCYRDKIEIDAAQLVVGNLRLYRRTGWLEGSKWWMCHSRLHTGW
jgi:hypothetical protein